MIMNRLVLLLLLIHCVWDSKAQTTLNKKDIDEIRLLARKKIQKSLPELINTLNLDDVSPEERKEVVQNSYEANPEQLFAGDSVMIDDDLSPVSKINSKKLRLSVAKYFAKSDSVLKKSSDPTFEISYIVVSEVKDTNQIVSISVFFRSFFKGEHTKIKENYKPHEQIAKFKVEKVGKRWQVWINDISLNENTDEGKEGSIKSVKNQPAPIVKELKYSKINVNISSVQCEERLKTFVLQNVATGEFFGAMVLMNLKEGVNIMDEFEEIPYEFEDVCGTMSEANKEQVYIFSKDPIMYRGNTIKITNMTFKSLQSNGDYKYYLIPKIDIICE
jgi:hypothetical protein